MLFVLIVPFHLHSQWVPDPAIDERIQRGVDFIYNLEFDKADREFDAVITTRPQHPVGYFFRAMTQWWRILSNFSDESHDERFYEMLEVVIDMCDERLDKNPNDVTALFFKGGAIGFRGRLRANRGKWLTAAKDGIVALPIVQRAHELEPNNYDVLLGIGIYNYYAEVIPNDYPVVKPFMLFFPKGDKKKGIEQLKLSAQNAKYARTEAMYFLLQSFFVYEKDYFQALNLAQTLHARYPRNPLFHRYVGRCYISLGEWSKAHKVFQEVERRYSARQIGYDAHDAREAYYYIGKFHFTAGAFDEAFKNFLRCDELSREIDKDGPSGFMSMANLHIGMIYDVQKKRQLAIKQYQKVLGMKEYENSHTQARLYITKPYGN
ncbi:MAG TPA: tetratricopeptide repeat protein [Bacteroidota bacterium]|nr:tetratricopeptide repeat protein [Bacteroidota bacterium]